MHSFKKVYLALLFEITKKIFKQSAKFNLSSKAYGMENKCPQ